MAQPSVVKSAVNEAGTHERHTLQLRSPGGRVRTAEYETILTPAGETANDRADRKRNNRNRALRARKSLAKMPAVAESPPAAPSAASELQASQSSSKQVTLAKG